MGEKIQQTEATTAVNGRVAQSVSTGTPGVSGALLMSGYRRVNVCNRRAKFEREREMFLDAEWQQSENNSKGNYYTLCKVQHLHLDLTSTMGGPITLDIWCEHGCSEHFLASYANK